MEHLTIQQFKTLRADEGSLLIDVREEYEFEEENIGGMNIPLSEVLDKLDKIGTDKTIIFMCKSGKRSTAIAQAVERKKNHPKVCILTGGLDAYLETTI